MRTFRLQTFLVLLTAVAVNATEPVEQFAALLSRQAPGTPQYECHSNCGSAIAGGRVEGYCTNSTWVGFYQECLECALDFDIWKYYGAGVSGPAAACGLSTVPSPSGDNSAAPSTTNAASGALPTTTAAVTGTSTSASHISITTTSTEAGPSTTAPPTVGTGSNATSATATGAVVTAGALRSHVAGYWLGLGTLVLGIGYLW